MPVQSALVTRFFQLIVNRQFTEAERELERIKQKMHKTEWNRGYFRGLYGMFLARKANGETYSFLSKIDLQDKSKLRNYRREFSDHVKNKLHADFDRGFFSAWADCMRILSVITIPEVAITVTQTPGEADTEENLEVFKADDNQPTMETFLGREEG